METAPADPSPWSNLESENLIAIIVKVWRGGYTTQGRQTTELMGNRREERRGEERRGEERRGAGRAEGETRGGGVVPEVGCEDRVKVKGARNAFPTSP
eukprot:306998-Hanusia_phi.AAC.1